MEPNAEAPDRSLNNVLDLICPQRGQQSPVFPFSAVRLPSSLSHVKYVSCSLMSWQIGCRSRLASSQKPCWYTWYLCVWSLACVTLALHSWLMSQSILDVFFYLDKAICCTYKFLLFGLYITLKRPASTLSLTFAYNEFQLIRAWLREPAEKKIKPEGETVIERQ